MGTKTGLRWYSKADGVLARFGALRYDRSYALMYLTIRVAKAGRRY